MQSQPMFQTVTGEFSHQEFPAFETIHSFQIFKELPKPFQASAWKPPPLPEQTLPARTCLVETNGIEPLTSCLQSRRSPN